MIIEIRWSSNPPPGMRRVDVTTYRDKNDVRGGAMLALSMALCLLLDTRLWPTGDYWVDLIGHYMQLALLAMNIVHAIALGRMQRAKLDLDRIIRGEE